VAENRGRFQKGHKRVGGRKKGGSKAQIELKQAILNAFAAVGGEDYLIDVAQTNPQVFFALLGRVLPLTVAGDAEQPHRIIVEWQEPSASG